MQSIPSTQISNKNNPCCIHHICRTKQNLPGKKTLCSVLEKFHEGVAVYNKQGIVIGWNQRMEEHTGIKRQNALNRNAWDIHADIINNKKRGEQRNQRTKAEIKKFFIKKEHPMTEMVNEYNTKDSKGKTKILQSKVNAININDNSLFISMLRDVTRLKQTEKKLQDRETQYKSLFQESPISLWEMDFSAVKKQIEKLKKSSVTDFKEYFERNKDEIGKCVELSKMVNVNKATLELYKAQNKKQFINRVNEIFIKGSGEVFKKILIAVAEGKTAAEGETKTKSMQGNIKYVFYKWAVARGYEKTLKKIFVSVIDITSQKKIFEELRNEKEFSDKLMHSMQDGLLMVNGDGNITFANPAFCRMTGFSQEDLIGANSPYPYWPKEDRDKLKRNLKATFDGDFKEVELNLKKKNGELFPVLLFPSGVKGDDGNIISFFGTFKDITYRKRMETELKLDREKLEERVKERTAELEEMNTALKVLLTHINKEKEILEESILDNCKVQVLPVIEKLKNSGLSAEQNELVTSLESVVSKITDPFLKSLFSRYPNMTFREREIVSFLMEGKTNKEIANFLHISVHTVALHRKHIREKLGIKGEKVRLITILKDRAG